MRKLIQRTKMFDEAKQGIVKKNAPEGQPSKPKGHNIIVEILIFLAVYLVISIISALPFIVIQTRAIMATEEYANLTQQLQNGVISASEYSTAVGNIQVEIPMLPQLFLTLISTVLTMLFCRFIEKRSLASMGFRKNGAVKEYLVGMLIGFGIFSLAVAISVVTGALKFGGMVSGINFAMIGLFFVGFLIQGMSEETLCRGYFMVSMSRRSHVIVAVIVSSLAFGAGHLLNPGVHPLAIVNVSLFGIFAGVYVLKRGNIWGICAIHSIWNFVQGNFYGIKVSGLDGMDTIFQMNSVEGKELINGGTFGLEGGIAVTIVLVVGTVIMLFTKTKQSELSETENQNA